jgi:NitT/TauT family transport system permease protein
MLSNKFVSQYLLPGFTFIVIIVLWQAVVVLLRIPNLFLPTPVEIFQATIKWWPVVFSHTWVTLYESILGFLLGVGLGVPLAIVIAYSPVLQNTIYPLLVLAQSIPKVAIAPLFLIWLGYGLLPKVLVAFLVAFFPIVVNTTTGLNEVEPEMIDLIRSLKASSMQIFRIIRLPNAIPYIIAGCKVSVTLSVIGAVIAEFVGSEGGLGYMILSASAELNTALNMAGLVFLSLIGIGLFWAVTLLEKLLFPWSLSDER